MADVIVGATSTQTGLGVARGKLVPSHFRQRWNFELGGFVAGNPAPLAVSKTYKDGSTRRPSARGKSKQREFFVSASVASADYFFEGVAYESESFLQGRTYIV